MKTKTINIYSFDELSDDAKETARNWYRDGALDYDWWEFVYEDAERVGLKITGFDLDRRRHAEGKFTDAPEDVAGSILKEHGDTCETYKTAAQFIADRASLIADLEDGTEVEDTEAYEDLKEEFLKSLLEDYSIILQNEYEYQLSDECVDETIRANDYEFLESGKRA